MKFKKSAIFIATILYGFTLFNCTNVVHAAPTAGIISTLCGEEGTPGCTAGITSALAVNVNKTYESMEDTKVATVGLSESLDDINFEEEEKENVEEEEKENVTISTEESDIDLLARLITAEMGYGQDEYCYYLTGSVVINRINSPKFPNTLTEVIYQDNPLQYGCTENGHIERSYDETAYMIAKDLLENGTTIPSDVIWQATFKQGNGIYEYTNNTYFCY